jgi:predicted dehydrogenase
MLKKYINAQRATEMGNLFGVDAVTDYRELLGRTDAVSVAVPTSEHYHIAKAFLERRTDVLVEKPMTATLDTALNLIEIARRNDRILQVGHLERFSGMIEMLRKHVRQPLFVDCQRIAPFKRRGTDINVILDLMIHDLDFIMCLVDSPIRSADAAGAPVFSETEDIANARIKFANGCIANIVASRISFKTERRMRIFEHDQYVTVDFDRGIIKTMRKTTGGNPSSFPPVLVEEVKYRDGDPLEQEIEAFVRSVVHRQKPAVSGEEGAKALEAAILLIESMRSHAAFVDERGGLGRVAAKANP